MDRWLWLTQGDAVTQATALLLLVLSVASWVVMGYKAWLLARSRRVSCGASCPPDCSVPPPGRASAASSRGASTRSRSSV